MRRRHCRLWEVWVSIWSPQALLKLVLFFCCWCSGYTAKIQHSSMDMIPIAIAPPSSHMDSIPTGMKELFGRVDAPAPIVPFDSLMQTIVMELGDVDAEFSFSFMAETGKNMSDYLVEVKCSNHAVLKEGDVTVGPPILMQNGRANYTIDIVFDRQVGQSAIDVVFRRPDRTIYTSITLHYIVCGISFFYYNKKTLGKTLVVNNEFSVTSFRDLTEDNLLLFYTFIQFPDGSTSEKMLGRPKRIPDLSTLTTAIKGDKLLASHTFETCLTNHMQRQASGTITLDKSCSFGFTSMQAGNPLYFGVRILQYHTGRVTFHFTWPSLLQGFAMNELFETSLSIRITGAVPVSIVSVTPSGPFRKSGGQLLECVVINASPKYQFFLTLGNYTRSVISRRVSLEGGTILSFLTPAGEGLNVPWDLSYSIEGTHEQTSCIWAGEPVRFIFNYLAEDIFIKSISPGFGPISGGTLVTCAGYFAGLNISVGSGDVIFLGPYALNRSYIVSVTTTSLVFTVPSMRVVQAPHYVLDCYVIVHGIRSNSVKYTYESLSVVTVDITGGSYEEQNDTFLVPMCGSGILGSDQHSITLFANVNKGAPLSSLVFEWHIVVMSTRTQIMKVSGSAQAQSLSVSLSKFSIGETYEAIVLTSDSRFNTRLKSSIQLQPTKLKRLGVGLSLDHTRTISLPPVDTRITATVTELGECYRRNHTLSYDWTFMAVTKTLTSSSKEVELRLPSPRRLGREYIIPSNKLIYGSHRVIVKVYYTDDPSTFGTATTWMNVEPAALQAMIGNGESLIQVSSSQTLEMSGSLSYDPDYNSREVRDTLSYQWQCDMSTEGQEKFTSVTACPNSFLPTPDLEHFSISSDILSSVRFINGSTHVRYSLNVRKSYKKFGVRSSSRTWQVVEIVRTKEVYAARGSISLSGFDGRAVQSSNVPYYEGFVISIDGPVGSAWRFKLLEPATDSFNFLQNPDNLLLLPGFYRPKEFIARRNSLGIRGGALQPGTEYKFEVQYESKKADSTTSVEVSIRTMPRATVTFLPLSRSTGTMETVFSAIAVPSLEYYEFKYYFYIKLNDGSEMCIDGCSGQRKVSFRVPMKGNHTVRCTMVDSRGKVVIHEATRVETIFIHDKPENETPLIAQSAALQESFDLGDHSTFEIESVHLASYAQKIRINDSRSSEMVSELVAVTIDKLWNMYRKTQPNTALAKDYVQITKSFTSIPLGSESLSNMETFYNLCRMLYFAVHNTPISERYDMTSELITTLAQLAGHARQMHDAGSSRKRLVASRTVEAHAVNEPLLALNEQVVPLMSQVLTRAEPCGHSAMANLSDVGVVRVAVGCNAEQASTIVGDHTRLEWCDRVYNRDGSGKVAFALGEFRDYIDESGVLSLRKGVERSDDEGENANVVDTRNMANQGYVIAKTVVSDVDGSMKGSDGVEGKCFTVVQEARASVAVLGGDVECQGVKAVEYRNVKGLEMKRMSEEGYTERSLESSEMGGRVNRAGNGNKVWVGANLERVNGRTFGVKRFGCRDLNPFIVGEIDGRWIAPVAVLSALVGVALLGLLGIGRVYSGRQQVWADGGDGPYIERDVYGRTLGMGDHGQFGADGNVVGGQVVGGEDEQVVFTNPSPRVIAGKVNDGRPVGKLFGDEA